MRRALVRRPWRSVALLVAGVSGAACTPEPRADVAGLWEGPLEHAGQESRFGLRLERDAEGELQASLALHALHTFDMAVGEAHLEGETLRIGSWESRFDAEAGTITGVIPAAILPVYEVPFTLRPVDAFETSPRAEPAPERAPLWTASVDSPVYAGLAVSEGRVFVATDAGTLHALREEDGAPLWSFEAEGALRATPTVEGNAVFLHSDGGRVYRLSAGSGEVVWSVVVEGPVERIPPGEADSRYDSYGASVILAGGAALTGSAAGALVALDAATGAERWRMDEDSSVLGTPSSDGETVFYGTFGGDVVARAVSDGSEVWRTRTGGAILNSPGLAGPVLVIGNRAYDLLGLSTADGAVAWTYYYWFSWVESTATIRDGVAYVGSSDGQRLEAVRAGDGRPVWHFDTRGATWPTPAVTDERVFVGTIGVSGYSVVHEARFHAVDRATGAPVWQLPMKQPEGATRWGYAASPAVGERHVYVGTLDGRVLALPLR